MTSVFESVLRISAEAAVLVLLVLGARLIVGRRPGLLLTVLYALIAVRLIVPFAVSSPLSVHNIWHEPQEQIEAAINNFDHNTVSDSHTPILNDVPQTQPSQAALVSDTAVPATAPQPQVTLESVAESAPLTALEIAALIWTLGMIVMMGTILTGNALFMRRIRRNRAYEAPEFAALLQACKQTLGLKRNIRAICASETGTAAVYGIFRPVLLISPASFETLTEAQKRHVLLHELSHIRRRDTLVCAGATMLNIVHWFNPLVWVVFVLMRRDIEVQCDAHVFRGLPGEERKDYAGTLLQLAGPVNAPKFAPALFISKANIKRRIVMIMKDRKKSALFTAAALLITLVVAVTGCTTAAPVPETNNEPVSMTTFTLDLSGYDKANLESMKKTADLINGMVIKPGETISFNDIVGLQDLNNTVSLQDTEAAKSAVNGDIVALGSYPKSDKVAAATALYNAAIRAELDIIEYKNGFFPPLFALEGLDEIVDTSGHDLKISNPYDSDITIEAKLDGAILSVSIYGPPMAYTVDFYSEKVKNEVSTPNTNDDNHTGIYTCITKTDIFPDGAKIEAANTVEIIVGIPEETYNIYKVYYDADGNEIKRELYESSDCGTMNDNFNAASGTPAPTPAIIGPATRATEPMLMSTFTLDNSPPPYDRPTRLNNIKIAADILNGTVIKPGETMSLNDLLGPRDARTAETVGWTLASGIKDGSYVSNIGGGITAVSTALYNAAIRAELNITEVNHCTLPYDLVDGGLDATISTGAPDLKISNPYDSYVTIEAKLEGTQLMISVYGPPMAYNVDFYSEKAADEDKDPVTIYIYNSATAPDGTDIAPGKSYEYAVERPQATYNVYKEYFDADGNITKQELYQTVIYHAIEGIVYVNEPDPATASASSGSSTKPLPTPTPKPSAETVSENQK